VTLGPGSLGRGVANGPEIRYCSTCFAIPNFVALGQTVWA